MIVAALVVAALLADRFVLLPEFEGGNRSALLAGALWASVNLLPAAVWLALHRGDRELTAAQRLQGALAIVAVTALGILPVLIWYGATGGPLSSS
ncbi:MAG: hypothetical protein M3383_08210 [Actinomycetota bacterium]|nr:hypothetical protein [Actinomycetota bacterium]